MSLIVKMMSAEPAADEDSRKSYHIRTGVTNVLFNRTSEGTPMVHLRFGDGLNEGTDAETHYPSGNVYVMNEAGKTISSFAAAPLPDSTPRRQLIRVTIDGEPNDIREGGWAGDELYQHLGATRDAVLWMRPAGHGRWLEISMGTGEVLVANGTEFIWLDQSQVPGPQEPLITYPHNFRITIDDRVVGLEKQVWIGRELKKALGIRPGYELEQINPEMHGTMDALSLVRDSTMVRLGDGDSFMSHIPAGTSA